MRADPAYLAERNVWLFLNHDHFQFVVCRAQPQLAPCESESANGIQLYHVVPPGAQMCQLIVLSTGSVQM